MKRIKALVIPLLALILLVFPTVVSAETETLTPQADSFVNDFVNYRDNNYGASHSLVVSFDSVYRWSLVQFDLGSLPGEAEIESAIFKAYLYNASGDASVPLMVSRITGSWSEMAINWNNRPLFDEAAGITVNVDAASGYKNWDVTEIVRGWKNNDFSNYGLALGHGSGNYSRSFHSREYSDNRPILEINYHLPEDIPTPTPSPEPTPTLAISPAGEITPSPELTPAPEVSPASTPEATGEAKSFLSLTTGQTIIAGFILLALIGAVIAFVFYFKRQSNQEPKKEKTKKEKKSEKEPAITEEEIE